MTTHERRVMALMRFHGLSKAEAEKRARSLAAKKNPAKRKTQARTVAPKRKTQARTQRAAEDYVYRQSQVTKKAPTERLITRRSKNLTAPVGVFPNPKSRGGIIVEASNGSAWKFIAAFPKTGHGSTDAIMYAKAYAKINPTLRIRVIEK